MIKYGHLKLKENRGKLTLKEERKKFYVAVKRELMENRNTFLVYTGLRLIVIAIMIRQFFNQNYEHVFLCLLTLLLMIMPSVLQVTFHIELPSPMEIVILCFIFAAEILGEISSFYIKFPHWDTILHTLNGFLCAAIGFSLVEILNRQKKLRFELSPLFMVIVAFCFSMTIGVCWEFFEFGMDKFFHLDMQKDTIVHTISTVMLDPVNENHRVMITGIEDVVINGESLGLGGYLDIGLFDTMYDLFVNFIGATVFSVMGYLYLKRKDSKSVIKGLVPEPWSKEEEEQVKSK